MHMYVWLCINTIPGPVLACLYACTLMDVCVCVCMCVFSRAQDQAICDQDEARFRLFSTLSFFFILFYFFSLSFSFFVVFAFLFLLLFACSSYFVFESCMYVTVVLSEGHVMRMALARRWMGLLRMVTVGIKYFCVATWNHSFISVLFLLYW